MFGHVVLFVAAHVVEAGSSRHEAGDDDELVLGRTPGHVVDRALVGLYEFQTGLRGVDVERVLAVVAPAGGVHVGLAPDEGAGAVLVPEHLDFLHVASSYVHYLCEGPGLLRVHAEFRTVAARVTCVYH